MGWQNNVRCDECGAIHKYAPSAGWANAFRTKYPCWKCGSTEHYNWSDVTERWVSTSFWWNPITWGNGFWQRKDGFWRKWMEETADAQLPTEAGCRALLGKDEGGQ